MQEQCLGMKTELSILLKKRIDKKMQNPFLLELFITRNIAASGFRYTKQRNWKMCGFFFFKLFRFLLD